MKHLAGFAIAALAFFTVQSSASRAQTALAARPALQATALLPGTIIDSKNVSAYTKYLPAAAELVVRHGFTIRVVPTVRVDWSAGFIRATEKYSPQVGLDSEDNITNYTAGAPFPTVDATDPKAAVKIAYNWHMGPFMPDDFSLTPWGSYAYSDISVAPDSNGTPKPNATSNSSEAPNTIQPKDDLTYSCNRFTFLRFAHRTEVDPQPTLGSNSQGFEWKARCDRWTTDPAGGVGEGAGIWIRFLDPHRGDEFYSYNPETRRIRLNGAWDTVNESCRSCHQPYWAYALPKTEQYSYRLLGTASILGCLHADEEPAGLVPGDKTFSMGEEPFELRSVYILEMTPKIAGYTNLRILAYIDTEAFVWLAAEFFDANERTATAIPLWRTVPAPQGGNLFDLAGEFYIPAKQPQMTTQQILNSIPRSSASGAPMAPTPIYPSWFFRSLMPAHGTFDQKINTGQLPEESFNPLTLSQ